MGQLRNLTTMHRRTILLDMDGTCFKHLYPLIGDNIGAEIVLKTLQQNGHRFIVFTMRDGKELNEAVDWMNRNALLVYGVQTNPTQNQWTTSPKAHGDCIIDDTCIGMPKLIDAVTGRHFINWFKLAEMLASENMIDAEQLASCQSKLLLNYSHIYY